MVVIRQWIAQNTQKSYSASKYSAYVVSHADLGLSLVHTSYDSFLNGATNLLVVSILFKLQ